MIGALLIANRGEIAVRIVRACRVLGIRPVAVYTSVDRDGPVVQAAGDAYEIPSYLDGEAIIDAAIRAGADAIHPGYGFLAENAAFAAQCVARGVTFVGPSATCIARMGSKIQAKALAVSLGIPTVPGCDGDDPDPGRIGFPLLVKASAGGGGRGMRRVDTPDALPAALDVARREAERAFGDGTVLIERFIARPRHIEVQLLGDRHGHLIHLFERDCSIQRHYQKIIEEAPAAFLSDAVRESLFGAALRLGRAMEYDSVGTVEFIVDADAGAFYFLEMNTRLQVEHPVTEAVTGLDLVALQIRVAAGEPLPIAQRDVAVNGWAIEARVIAEDPARGYEPSLGTVRLVELPSDVRVESGIVRGSSVTPHYDALLAKIVAHGPDRVAAARRLDDALRRCVIAGVRTNISFLRDLLAPPVFIGAPLTTDYIGLAFPDGWHPSGSRDARELAVGAVLYVAWSDSQAGGDPWQGLRGWRLGGAPETARVVLDGTLVLVAGAAGRYRVTVGDDVWELRVAIVGETATIDHDGHLSRYVFAVDEGTVAFGDRWFAVTSRVTETSTATAEVSERVVRAPLPGIIARVSTTIGARVCRGEEVITMEAMKLMHRLEAPVDGHVRAVHCREGMTVPRGTVLVEVEP